jgi:hypothetical protein
LRCLAGAVRTPPPSGCCPAPVVPVNHHNPFSSRNTLPPRQLMRDNTTPNLENSYPGLTVFSATGSSMSSYLFLAPKKLVTVRSGQVWPPVEVGLIFPFRTDAAFSLLKLCRIHETALAAPVESKQLSSCGRRSREGAGPSSSYNGSCRSSKLWPAPAIASDS